jgi:hypothetical protein
MGRLSAPRRARGEFPLLARRSGRALTARRITLHFKDAKGNPLKTVEANEGDDILSIAHEHDIDLEGASSSYCSCRC